MSRLGTISARQLLTALALSAIGILGAWPGREGTPDPVALLVWLALIAPAVGVATSALRLPFWPAAVLVPATWMFLVVFADALSVRDLPQPIWAGCAVAGLLAIGFALGSLTARSPWRTAGIVLLVNALLCALPLSGGFLREHPPAPVNARLLDLSPATLVVESSGVDWMRHPAIYDAASTSDIDPILRSAYDGRLAASLVFVVGCALALAVQRIRDRRWPNTATSAPSRKS